MHHLRAMNSPSKPRWQFFSFQAKSWIVQAVEIRHPEMILAGRLLMDSSEYIDHLSIPPQRVRHPILAA